MTIESLNSLHRRPQRENRTAWLANICATVIVTTICNRKCPLCSYADIVRGEHPEHFPVDAILKDVASLHRVGKVKLMGGEITLHPDVEVILREARKIRGAAPLSITTNGARLLDIAETTKYVDEIFLSVYENSVETSSIVKEYKKVKPPNVQLRARVPIHITRVGNSFPCIALRETIAVMRSEVYPCCGSVGIANAAHTPLAEGWEKRLLYVEAPCEKCVAAG